MNAPSLKQLSAVVLSFSFAAALSACGGGQSQCSLLEPCADGGSVSATGGGGGGSGGGKTGGGHADAGASGYNCSQLQHCYTGCANLAQAQQAGCVSTCNQGAMPESLSVSQTMWNCINASSCTTNACADSACPSQIQACSADTGVASSGGSGGGSGTASIPQQLVAEWDRNGMSTVGTYNTSTGAWSSPTGTGTAYHFYANGTFTFAGLLIVGGDCTTAAFVWRQGTVTVSGNQMTLVDQVNQIDIGDCSSGVTHPQGLGVESKTWSLDSSGTQLTLTDNSANGGTLVYAKQ